MIDQSVFATGVRGALDVVLQDDSWDLRYEPQLYLDTPDEEELQRLRASSTNSDSISVARFYVASMFLILPSIYLVSFLGVHHGNIFQSDFELHSEQGAQ